MDTRKDHLDPLALAEEVRAAKLPPVSERRSVRDAAGVTVREAAAAIGVSPMTFLRWEHGEATPRRRHAAAYASLLAALRDAVA